MTQWSGGKGSRPRKVDKKRFDSNWDAIWGKNDDINSTQDNEGVLDGVEEEGSEEKEEEET
jgi:hypothetical protein